MDLERQWKQKLIAIWSRREEGGRAVTPQWWCGRLMKVRAKIVVGRRYLKIKKTKKWWSRPSATGISPRMWGSSLVVGCTYTRLSTYKIWNGISTVHLHLRFQVPTNQTTMETPNSTTRLWESSSKTPKVSTSVSQVKSSKWKNSSARFQPDDTHRGQGRAKWDL